MKIGVTGSTGFLGESLIPVLRADGHEVFRFVRRLPAGSSEIRWDPAEGRIDAGPVDQCDTIIHLAGEPIAARWTPKKKTLIWDSRVGSTSLIAGAMAKCPSRPRTLICASAVGYYGDRGSEPLTESSSRGTGYLAELVEAWEQAATPARDAGVRVIHLRLGLALGTAGGALPKMLPAFRFGFGGRLGDGKQFFPWIHVEDATGAILHVLHGDLNGPVNIVGPEAVTNAVFAKTLGRVLRRPTVVPVPAAGLRLLFGEMADEVLLAGQRMGPGTLVSSGYRFKHPKLLVALRDLLAA